MLAGITEVFRIPEVRKRILFTLGAILIFRLGTWIPVPGIDSFKLGQFFESLRQSQSAAGQILSFVSLFTGGALTNYSVFALGVIPYINASIILSLLVAVVPRLKELQQQGEEGRQVINKITRYGTVGLAILQALGTSFFIVQSDLVSPDALGGKIGFYFLSVLALTTGTMFLMWLGERITENGIGRGISMIIMAGIMASYPTYFYSIATEIYSTTVNPIWGIVLPIFYIAMTAAVVAVQLGVRRIDIQYAKRIVKGRVYGGHNTYLPLQVNQGGVIPIIFAAALMTIPSVAFNFLENQAHLVFPGWLQAISDDLQRGQWLYLFSYALLIVFFTYFYSAIVFNPRDMSDNLRKWGGFIPGIRPGKPTGDYIEGVQGRMLFVGATFLVLISLIPYTISFAMTSNSTSANFLRFIGGTSILIVVGVAVDTLKQIEAHMVERHYESLIQKGSVLGRK
ncbi:preprotein translocase subunit SecY [Candidatus Acetothermia bacterium]|nr:preprotein translocase subunit SecY [Candidatus Acetothermia bacterium]MBI3659199.1 preprotein translocase subunit SecY [Candidatus Acetothermia bacterium]